MKSRLRYELGPLLVSAAALCGVLLALARGASRHRWAPTAAFLSISTAAALYTELTHHLIRLRARRQASADVPRGVRLRKPTWISIRDALFVIHLGALLAAAAAAVGFTGVGVGIMLTVCLLHALTEIPIRGMSVDDVTFEPDGLRVHLRDVSFLIRWNAIAAVEREGARERNLVRLALLETASAVASAEPDTERNRRRVQLATYDGDHPGGKLTLLGWTGGLDSDVLLRAVRAAIGDPPAPLN